MKIATRLISVAVAGIFLVGGATSAQAVDEVEDLEGIPSEAFTTGVLVEEAAPDSETLDPATYAGPLLVATDEGEIFVNVEAGEAQMFSDRPDGSLASMPAQARQMVTEEGVSARRANCGEWHMANTGAGGTYLESLNGCAVIGYAGYTRPYSWENMGDYTECVQGRSGSNAWYTLGCAGPSGSQSDKYVPWGNVLNYTKTKGMSVSFTSQYIWFN